MREYIEMPRKTMKRRRSRAFTARQRGGLSNPFKSKTPEQKAANKAIANNKAAKAKAAANLKTAKAKATANLKAATAKATSNLKTKEKSNSLRLAGKKSLERQAAEAAKKKAEASAKVAVEKATAANKAIAVLASAIAKEQAAIEKYKSKYGIQSNNIDNISREIQGVFERRKFTSIMNEVVRSEKAAETAIKAVDDANKKAAEDALLYETAVNTAFAEDSKSEFITFERTTQELKNSATNFKTAANAKVTSDAARLKSALNVAITGVPAAAKGHLRVANLLERAKVAPAPAPVPPAPVPVPPAPPVLVPGAIALKLFAQQKKAAATAAATAATGPTATGPAATGPAATAATGPAATGPDNNDLPKGWTLQRNNASGKNFYYNNSDPPFSTWIKPTKSSVNARTERVERGAKLYADIQAGTETATPAQQACIKTYDEYKKAKQTGGRRTRKRKTLR